MKNDNHSDKTGIIALIIIFVISFAIFAACGGFDSNSGTKWSDLSEQEKENARWAYKVKQQIDDN